MLLQTVDNDLVGYLNLTVGLMVGYWGAPSVDFLFLWPLFQRVALELSTVVNNQDFGVPNRERIFFHLNFIICLRVTMVNGSTSIHLLMQSTTTSKNLGPPRTTGNSPMIFIPHLWKGHGLLMLVSSVVGWFWKGAKAWHSEHLFFSSSTSLYMSGQYTPKRSIFPVSAHAPSCTLASPAWYSSKSDSPFVWATHLSHGARYPLLYSCFSLMENYGDLNLSFLATTWSSGRMSCNR